MCTSSLQAELFPKGQIQPARGILPGRSTLSAPAAVGAAVPASSIRVVRWVMRPILDYDLREILKGSTTQPERQADDIAPSGVRGRTIPAPTSAAAIPGSMSTEPADGSE